MSDAHLGDEQAGRQTANAPTFLRDAPVWRRLAMYLILVVVGAVGLLLKHPFGILLAHIMGKPANGPHTLLQWMIGDVGSLVIVAAGLLLHHRSGLPMAPYVERIVFREIRSPKPAILRPGLVGAMASAAAFLASQLYTTISGATVPLTAKLSAGAIPRAELIKLAALYPLASIGAALSEEVIFRFGLMSALVGLMALMRVGGSKPANAWMFWSANILQAVWFGFGHVAEGLLNSQNGGFALATLTAPQTWSALVFGYVYRRWGLETAIVAHMASDLFIPVAIACWRLATGL